MRKSIINIKGTPLGEQRKVTASVNRNNLTYTALAPMFVFVYAFIVRLPSLEVFQYSFLIPTVLFVFLTLVFVFSNWKVSIDVFFFAFLLMLPFLFVSLFLGPTRIVLPMVVSLLFLLFLLVSVKPYEFFWKRILVWRYRYHFRLLFLIFPLSILAQKVNPGLFELYNNLIYYGSERFVYLNLNGLRYSGLIDGTGTGGSTILAGNYFLYFFYEAKIAVEKDKSLWSFPLWFVSMAYLVAIFLMGTSGALAIFTFLLVLLISAGGVKHKAVFGCVGLAFVSFVYLLAVTTTINGLQYIRVFHYSGIEAMLGHGSFAVLLSFYEGFQNNFAYVVSQGGFFGSDAAKGLYEVTDVGILNQIHVLGVVGLVFYNLFLFFLLLLSFKAKRIGGLLGDVVFSILVASIVFLLLLQLKEFSHVGNSLYAVVVMMYGFVRFASTIPGRKSEAVSLTDSGVDSRGQIALSTTTT